jgi:hypothetical protein
MANDGRHEITAIGYLRLDLVGKTAAAPSARRPGRDRHRCRSGTEPVMTERLLPLYITFIAAHIVLIAVVIALG